MELLPREQVAFQRMSDVVRQVFERFGFVPIATPAIELSEVLLTKSGGDTERQVYFVQSTGALGREGDALPELALRYDLTVPLARYVAEHEHQLAFPFRRYQMQRVYRGERAQRGRFREFHQCDIDVIGKDTLDIGFDAEMPAVIDAVFSELSIGAFTIQLNHRKLMHGFLEHAGVEGGERQAAVLREIDKLDRLGPEAVEQTLAGPGFGLAASTIDRIREFVAIRSNGLADGLARIEAFGSRGPQFDAGASELREVLERIRGFGVADDRVAINLSIARGLDYYTGTVYETTLDDWPAIGSICSGGRYENLAGSYTRSRLPGVGISIGLTRLFWQLSQAGKVDCGDSCVQVLVAWSAEACRDFATDTASMLRRAGLNTELQLQGRKLARQFQYADRAGIRFVVVCGEDEASRDAVAVKDLRSGEQLEYGRERLAGGLHAALAGGDAG